jgi:hypothetical protein
MRLLKCLENSLLLIQRDSYACIANRELQTSAAVRNRLQRYIHAHFAMLGEFDRIPYQIDQDLSQSYLVTDQVSRHIGRDTQRKFQALLVR